MYSVFNDLEAASIFEYYLRWVNFKLDRVDFQIATLEQNLFILGLGLDKPKIDKVLTPEEQKKISKLITSNRILLEENISPPEAQYIAKIELEIFKDIMNGGS